MSDFQRPPRSLGPYLLADYPGLNYAEFGYSDPVGCALLCVPRCHTSAQVASMLKPAFATPR